MLEMRLHVNTKGFNFVSSFDQKKAQATIWSRISFLISTLSKLLRPDYLEVDGDSNKAFPSMRNSAMGILAANETHVQLSEPKPLQCPEALVTSSGHHRRWNQSKASVQRVGHTAHMSDSNGRIKPEDHHSGVKVQFCNWPEIPVDDGGGWTMAKRIKTEALQLVWYSPS